MYGRDAEPHDDAEPDDDGESLLRAQVPARLLVRLRKRKLRTGRNVQAIVNDAMDRYLQLQLDDK